MLGSCYHRECQKARKNKKEMNGKLYIIGTGPGNIDYMCGRAVNAIKESETLVGYKMYIDLLENLADGKELLSSGMMKEVERCNMAIDEALKGKVVSLVSSGDPGVYGMAGITLELIESRGLDVEVEVVPGITSALSGGSLLGAPLMNDFAVVSLSDLMVPWDIIMKKVEAAAMGDFVTAIYNPRSKKRVKHLEVARELFLKYQKPETPVGIIKNSMRENQEVIITDLENLLNYDIDMTTTVIVGNSRTNIVGGKMVTARGYKV